MKNIWSFFPKKGLLGSTELFKSQKNVTYSGAGNSSSKALILSDIFESLKSEVGNVLWIVNNVNEQNSIKKALDLWGSRQVFLYSKISDDESLTFPTISFFIAIF